MTLPSIDDEVVKNNNNDTTMEGRRVSIVLARRPKGLLPKSMRSLPKKMPPSRQLLTTTRMSSHCRRFLLPASTFNVHWDRGAQVTQQTTAVLVKRTSIHNCYLVNHYVAISVSFVDQSVPSFRLQDFVMDYATVD